MAKSESMTDGEGVLSFTCGLNPIDGLWGRVFRAAKEIIYGYESVEGAHFDCSECPRVSVGVVALIWCSNWIDRNHAIVAVEAAPGILIA